MAFDVIAITQDIAAAILAWCGVDSPTPAEVVIAEMASASAQDTINHYRKVTVFEPEYRSLAIEIGVYLYQKRGVDGTTGFTENGVTRQYEAGSVPASLLSRITLPAKVG